MIEAVDRRARGLRPVRSEGLELTGFLRRLDWVLLAAVAALLGYGLWAIAGITKHDITGDPSYYVVRQGVYAAVGVVGLAVLVLVDPDYYRRYKRAIYIGTTGIMLLVLLGGTVSRHSKRWLDLGFFRFQPSEFGKLLFVLFLAGFLADRARRLGESRTVLEAIGFASVPILLVFVQPDVGTAMVYTVALAGVLFVAGRALGASRDPRRGRRRVRADRALAAAGRRRARAQALPGAAPDALHAPRPRIPAGATYNVAPVDQRRRRRRLPRPRRRRLDADEPRTSCPEHATDFAFASLAEQRGFVGVSILLLLYLLVVWRGLKIDRRRARRVLGDRRGRDRGRVPVPDLRQRRHERSASRR